MWSDSRTERYSVILHYIWLKQICERSSGLEEISL